MTGESGYVESGRNSCQFGDGAKESSPRGVMIRNLKNNWFEAWIGKVLNLTFCSRVKLDQVKEFFETCSHPPLS